MNHRLEASDGEMPRPGGWCYAHRAWCVALDRDEGVIDPSEIDAAGNFIGDGPEIPT